MKLKDLALKKVQSFSKPRKLSDGGGLHLLVQPNGSKLWRLSYRFGGKQKTLALGVYPSVSLADARTRRDDAKRLLAHSIDPAAQRKSDRRALVGNTFREVANEMLAKVQREGRADVTLAKKRWLLAFAFPAFGNQPVGEISARDLLELLKEVEARGLYETAKRLRSTCGMVFRYAIATQRAERDPSADLRGALTSHQVVHRAAIVEPLKIGSLLRAIDGFDGQPTTRLALRLAPHVFVRPGELRQAEWAEFDLEAAVWSIAPSKMKMRRAHRVPLSKQSLKILREVQRLNPEGKLVFPGLGNASRPLSENTLNAALRRLGYSSSEMSAHGFRSMAATRLNEMGCWNPDAIERQLAHQEANAVRRAYMHGAEFWPERVRMMQSWSDYLDELRSGPALRVLRKVR